jgi:hypothetical protein
MISRQPSRIAQDRNGKGFQIATLAESRNKVGGRKARADE